MYRKLEISSFAKNFEQQFPTKKFQFFFSFYLSFYFNQDTRLSRDGGFAQITYMPPDTTCRLSLSKQRFFFSSASVLLNFLMN